MTFKHLSHMQKLFVKYHARTGDPHYAAWKAGYANPISSGNILARNLIVADASRAETQRFLFDKGGGLSVYKLVQVLNAPDASHGAVIAAARELAKLSNIAISDAAAEKAPDELTAGELAHEVERFRRELERSQKQAKEVLARLPAAILEQIADGNEDIFG